MGEGCGWPETEAGHPPSSSLYDQLLFMILQNAILQPSGTNGIRAQNCYAGASSTWSSGLASFHIVTRSSLVLPMFSWLMIGPVNSPGWLMP